jgi:hypothetical protein
MLRSRGRLIIITTGRSTGQRTITITMCVTLRVTPLFSRTQA